MALTLFGRLSLKLLALLLLCCAALPVFGGRRPVANDAWTNFGFLTCQLPCFAGITPGETIFSDTSTLLTRHVPVLDPRIIASGSSVNFFARLPGQQLGGVVRYQSGGQVGEIRINAVLPIESLLFELGTPDCILANATASPDQSTIIFWERGAISIAAVLGSEANALGRGANTFALWLRAVTPPDCSLRGARAWHGFAPLWTYKTGD